MEQCFVGDCGAVITANIFAGAQYIECMNGVSMQCEPSVYPNEMCCVCKMKNQVIYSEEEDKYYF